MEKKKIIINWNFYKWKFFLSKNYIEYESKGDRSKTLSVKEYLNKIRAYLTKSNRKKSDTWKIQLTIAINFISSKDMMKSV